MCRRRGDHPGMRVAAIDVGSNGIKRSVAEVCRGGGLEVLDRGRFPMQIAALLDRDGVIGCDGIARIAAAVAAQCGQARAYGVDRMAIVGTAAARESADRAALQAAVEAAAGLPLVLVTGEQEAMLTWDAIQARHRPEGAAAMIDVGGGSTEFVVASGTTSLQVASVPVGAIGLADRFAAEGAWSAELRLRLSAHVRTQVQRSVPRPAEAPAEVYVTGGTVAALAMMNLGGVPLPSDRGPLLARIDGAPLEASAVERWLGLLAASGCSERAATFGIEPARARILPAGCLILQEALLWMRADAACVNELGIRDGIMLRLAEGRPVS